MNFVGKGNAFPSALQAFWFAIIRSEGKKSAQKFAGGKPARRFKSLAPSIVPSFGGDRGGSRCNHSRVPEHNFQPAEALLSASKSIAFRLQKHCFQTAKALLPASKVNEVAMQSQCFRCPKAMLLAPLPFAPAAGCQPVVPSFPIPYFL